ncbi:MAG: hypothetical protein AAFQ77_03790, partial [Myxococcota bacterium]
AIMSAAGDISEAAIQKSTTMAGDFVDSGATDFEIFQPIFLTAQPNTDGSSLRTSDYQDLVATSDEDASHVLIIGKQTDVPWTFLNLTSFSDSDENFGVQSWAAAELVDDQVRTNERIMICGGPAFEDLQGGEMIQLNKSRNGVWQEGDYGAIASLLDDAAGTCSALPDGSSEQISCLLALDNPLSYLHGRTVSGIGDQTNQDGTDSQSFHAGLNSRFNVWDEELGELSQSEGISADENTIVGDIYTCTGVDYDTVTDTAGLPQDQCFIEGRCTTVSTGVTQEMLDEYCERNHGGACPTDADGNVPTSRYELYLAEVAKGLLEPAGHSNLTCNTSSTPKANRRVIEVAIVDCSGIAEGDINPTDVPVMAYAEIFLTEPVNSSDYYVANFDSFTKPDGTVISMMEGDVISTDSEYEGEGYTAYDPYVSVGMTITAINGRENASQPGEQGNSNHAPMLFNTAYYSGGDNDLAHSGRGNVLIMSENDDDRDRAEREGSHRTGPDDDAKGGTIIFRFDEPTYVHSLVVYDTEGGGAIRVYDELLTDDQLADLNLDDGDDRDMPNEVTYVEDDDNSQEVKDRLAGAFWATGAPNMHDHEYTTVLVQQQAVRMLVYTFEDDSGALDGIVFSNSKTDYQQRDQITAEFIDYIEEGDGRMSSYAQISN